MENYKKARRWARLCFIVTVAKFVFCVAGIALSGPAPPPDDILFDHIAFGWAKIGFFVFVTGMSLIPFYRKALLPQPERVDTRRYMALAIGLDGVIDVIRNIWPHELHAWLWPFSYPFAIFLVLAMHFDFSDPNDKPRKKRKFKAKWPAWIKKRWPAAPRHHRPQPQPQPQPSPRPTN